MRVTLITDLLEPSTWEDIENVASFRDLMVGRFPAWPENARIYDGQVAEDRDVTPALPADVERLESFEYLIVVVYPQGTALIIAIAVAVALTVVTLLLMPKISLDNRQTPSPNNALGERQNRPRPNARIPDIYGQVRSYPDGLGQPYRVWDDHHQLEIGYFCIGRGSYLVEDIRDGDTLIADISGSSCAIYGPFHSPNEGLPPDIQIGTAIGDPVFNVRRLNEVNGQTLKAPNDTAVQADQEIKFKDGGIIEASGGGIDFTDYFTADDEIVVGRTDTSGATAAVPIQVAAIAAELGSGGYGRLIFPGGYNPIDDFEEGQTILLSQAVWLTTTAGSTGGDIGAGQDGGGDANPDYPDWQFPEVEVPI